MLTLTGGAHAQSPDSDLPSFLDQRQRLTQPPLPDLPRLRFLTATDYPPFNFLDQRGQLTGFNVDLARAICVELGILPRCQMEALPFGDLADALSSGQGEAVIAGLAMNADSRNRFSFSQPYLRFPARFVTRTDDPIDTPIAANLGGKVTGIVEGTAHAAMFGSFFPNAQSQTFTGRTDALAALKAGRIDAVFGDGIDLSFWLESEPAEACCAFSGGPFLSDEFLGEGLAIGLAADAPQLARAVDYALVQIVEDGTFSELLLRYFPVSPW